MASETLFLPFLIVSGVLAYLGVNSKNEWAQLFFMFGTLAFCLIGLAEADAQGAIFGDAGVNAAGLVIIVWTTIWFLMLFIKVFNYLKEVVSKAW